VKTTQFDPVSLAWVKAVDFWQSDQYFRVINRRKIFGFIPFGYADWLAGFWRANQRNGAGNQGASRTKIAYS
jgi:hypothetical protein